MVRREPTHSLKRIGGVGVSRAIGENAEKIRQCRGQKGVVAPPEETDFLAGGKVVGAQLTNRRILNGRRRDLVRAENAHSVAISKQ